MHVGEGVAFPGSTDGSGCQALSKLFWGCLDGVRGGGGLSLLPPEGLGTMAGEGAAHKAPGHCAPPGRRSPGPPGGAASQASAEWSWLPRRRPPPPHWSPSWCEDTLLSWDSESGVLFTHQGIFPAWELLGASDCRGCWGQRGTWKAPAPDRCYGGRREHRLLGPPVPSQSAGGSLSRRGCSTPPRTRRSGAQRGRVTAQGRGGAGMQTPPPKPSETWQEAEERSAPRDARQEQGAVPTRLCGLRGRSGWASRKRRLLSRVGDWGRGGGVEVGQGRAGPRRARRPGSALRGGSQTQVWCHVPAVALCLLLDEARLPDGASVI